MTSVISAVGEATGMKPEDKVIGLALMGATHQTAERYMNAVIATSSAELRHLFQNHLQDELAAHERTMALASRKGWLRPDLSAQDWIQMAASDAKSILE